MLRFAAKSDDSIAGIISAILGQGLTVYSDVLEKTNAYAAEFANAINRRTEFFLYWYRNLKSEKDIVIDTYYPSQTVGSLSVGGAGALDDMLRLGSAPLAICHSHHEMGAHQSIPDISSLKVFTDDLSMFNAITFLKNEPLIRICNMRKSSGSEARLENPLGTLGVQVSLHDADSDENFAEFYNLLQRSTLFFSAEQIKYGYSVVTDNAKRWDVAVFVKYMCNSCDSHLDFPEKAQEIIRSEAEKARESAGGRRARDFTEIRQGYILMPSKLNIIERKPPLEIDFQKIEEDIRLKTKVGDEGYGHYQR